MHGRIWVKSAPAKGSTFHVMLPLALQKDCNGDGSTALRGLHGKRVLVIDDHVFSQTHLLRLLEKEDCRVHAVDGDIQALAALRDYRFDLVLVDGGLAEADEFAVVKAIRRSTSKHRAKTPIIVVLDEEQGDEESRFSREGVDGSVIRPIIPDQLLATAQLAMHNSESTGDDEDHDVTAEDQTVKSVLDKETALQRIGGDESVLCEMAVLFLEQYPELLENVRQSVEQGDARAIEQAAHRFKSAVSNFFAKRAFDAAESLEASARHGRLENLEQAYDQFCLSVRELKPAIEALAERAL
jgi:CheY-like chemotaxis protein